MYGIFFLNTFVEKPYEKVIAIFSLAKSFHAFSVLSKLLATAYRTELFLDADWRFPVTQRICRNDDIAGLVRAFFFFLKLKGRRSSRFVRRNSAAKNLAGAAAPIPCLGSRAPPLTKVKTYEISICPRSQRHLRISCRTFRESSSVEPLIGNDQTLKFLTFL